MNRFIACLKFAHRFREGPAQVLTGKARLAGELTDSPTAFSASDQRGLREFEEEGRGEEGRPPDQFYLVIWGW